MAAIFFDAHPKYHAVISCF